MLNEKTLALLNSTLKDVNITDINPNEDSFQNLRDGYYLCEIESAELKETKQSGLPMASFRFIVVQDGLLTVVDADGTTTLLPAENTKNRKIFQNYVLKDEKSVTRFVKDMLKLEGEVEGESLLPKEAFMTGETLNDALEVTVGSRIYIQISSTTNDDDTVSTWTNLVAWSRAKKLDLPM